MEKKIIDILKGATPGFSLRCPLVDGSVTYKEVNSDGKIVVVDPDGKEITLDEEGRLGGFKKCVLFPMSTNEWADFIPPKLKPGKKYDRGILIGITGEEYIFDSGKKGRFSEDIREIPEKGHWYRCLRDVKMSNGSFPYRAGGIYLSEFPGCITEEDTAQKKHSWETGIQDYFEEWSPIEGDILETVGGDVVLYGFDDLKEEPMYPASPTQKKKLMERLLSDGRYLSAEGKPIAIKFRAGDMILGPGNKRIKVIARELDRYETTAGPIPYPDQDSYTLEPKEDPIMGLEGCTIGDTVKINGQVFINAITLESLLVRNPELDILDLLRRLR